MKKIILFAVLGCLLSVTSCKEGVDEDVFYAVRAVFDKNGGHAELTSYNDDNKETPLPNGVWLTDIAEVNGMAVDGNFFDKKVKTKKYDNLYTELSNKWISVQSFEEDDNRVIVDIAPTDVARTVRIELSVRNMLCFLFVSQSAD